MHPHLALAFIIIIIIALVDAFAYPHMSTGIKLCTADGRCLVQNSEGFLAEFTRDGKIIEERGYWVTEGTNENVATVHPTSDMNKCLQNAGDTNVAIVACDGSNQLIRPIQIITAGSNGYKIILKVIPDDNADQVPDQVDTDGDGTPDTEAPSNLCIQAGRDAYLTDVQFMGGIGECPSPDQPNVNAANVFYVS